MYANLKIAIDSESLNIYVETGGEPIQIVYWHEDEWKEDAEMVVPAIMNAINLFYTKPLGLIKTLCSVKIGEFEEISSLLITHEELAKFKEDWGQTHEEICSCLGYDEEGSDDLIMNDGYFWDENSQLWLNKCASGFEGKDQLIADFLRHNQ